jgi:hypothetical protein
MHSKANRQAQATPRYTVFSNEVAGKNNETKHPIRTPISPHTSERTPVSGRLSIPSISPIIPPPMAPSNVLAITAMKYHSLASGSAGSRSGAYNTAIMRPATSPRPAPANALTMQITTRANIGPVDVTTRLPVRVVGASAAGTISPAFRVSRYCRRPDHDNF